MQYWNWIWNILNPRQIKVYCGQKFPSLRWRNFWADTKLFFSWRKKIRRSFFLERGLEAQNMLLHRHTGYRPPFSVLKRETSKTKIFIWKHWKNIKTNVISISAHVVCGLNNRDRTHQVLFLFSPQLQCGLLKVCLFLCTWKTQLWTDIQLCFNEKNLFNSLIITFSFYPKTLLEDV